MKKILSMVLILVVVTTLLSNVAFAASWPSLSTSSYCEFTANKTINVYRNASLNTRGTSSPAKSYNAYIDNGDVCRIYQITSNYIYLAYPTSSGYKYGYIRKGDVFGVSSPSESFTSKGKVTTYKYAGWSSYGYVASGDVVYKVGTSGNYTLVIYAAKSGNRAYKVGYVKTSDYNNIKPTEKKTSQNVANRPTVRSGSTGSAVKSMQTMLNKVINAGLSVDGVCGTKSVAAIKDFQRAAGLSVDGICGANTWTKLESYYNSGKVLNVSKATNSNQSGSNKTSSTSKSQTSIVSTQENGVSYTYVTKTVDTSSFNNWLSSMKKNESDVCSLGKGIIVAAKVKSYQNVIWQVPRQGPGNPGTKSVKYKVPRTIQYKVHKHTRQMGFGKSWYYANQCINVIYTCNCGYRKELIAWEIPLPDFSGSQTTKTVIQGLPQIN